MAVFKSSCLFMLPLLLKIYLCQNEVPEVTIEVFKPISVLYRRKPINVVRISVPDIPYMDVFAFQGNINKRISTLDVGIISGELVLASNGMRVYGLYEDLKLGDVIQYYVIVSFNNESFVKGNLNYTVTEVKDRRDKVFLPGGCKKTATKVLGTTVCAGRVIFEDNFNALNEHAWQIEEYIPAGPEFPFVSYQRLAAPTVYASSGYLHIKPQLQQNLLLFKDEAIYTGVLDLLSGCTASEELCLKKALGAGILPPIVSGRVTAKSFAFTYGKVEIRAKLPQGDWLYPEMLLEPYLKKYGSQDYASGVIKIASARGNPELYVNSTDYGNRVLYGGPVLDKQCRDKLLTNKALHLKTRWGDTFHLYAVVWTPDNITLSVDGQEWANVKPTSDGFHSMFDTGCNISQELWTLGSKMAPFDDHFYLTLGVAAGGISEFPDGANTFGGRPKPWRNQASKAMLTFWQDMTSWIATWNQPEMLIDYVKVTAL